MWQIMRLRNTNEEDVDDDLFSLACGPNFRVRKYSSCIVNGVRFNNADRDKNKKTQNSGVISQSTHNGQVTIFFGTLKEIIQLDYNERSILYLNMTGLNWMGRGLNLKMMNFLEALMLEVHGTRIIVIFWPLRLGRSSICQTQDLEKISKLYRHLNTGIFTMLAKPRRYNIMVLHIKRMNAANRRASKNQFLIAQMTNL
jgi:hypothetical protein